MIQDGPWNRYRQQAPATAAPARIMGAPKTPDPIDMRRLDLSEQANDRANQANERAATAAERAATAAERGAEKLNESQAKATGFYASALGSEAEWKALETDPELKPGTQPVGMWGDAARAVLPANVVNQHTSAARQRAQQAKENFIRASLRLESGAAIGPVEFERQDRIFYPQTGDDPTTLEQKARARQAIIDGFKIEAGPGADKVEGLPSVEAKRVAPMDKDQYAAQLGKMIMVGARKEDILRFADESGYKIDDPDRLDSVIGSKVGIQVNPYPGEDYGKDFARGVGGVVQGVGDVLGILANPVNAGLNATGIPQALGAGELSTDIGASMRSGLGLPFPETNGQRVTDAITRGGTAGLLTVGAAGAAAGPTAFAGGGGGGGATTNALARFAAAPITDTVAGASGAASGEVARQNGAGVLGQIGASLLGGGVAALGGSGMRSITQPRTANALVEAARRQGVDVLPADVGGTTVRKLTAGAAQGPFSSGPIVAKAQRSQTQMQVAAGRAASREGSVLPADEAGMSVRKAGEAFSAQSSQRGGRLYDRARDLAGDTRPEAKHALEAIDTELARLADSSDVNAPLIRELEKFRKNLARPGGLSVSGLRDVRTTAGKAAYSDDLRSTPARESFRRITDAIAQDVTDGLNAAGKGKAARAFKIADDFWSKRVEDIDEVLEPIVGKGKSGEDILQAFEGMAQGKRGGVDRLSRMIRLLPEQEAGDVQATIIDRLGRASAGQQNDVGTTFSSGTFLTNWNKMSDKAKATLFPSTDTRGALDDIAKLADGMKQSQRHANHSNTGGGIMSQIVLSGGAGVAGGFKGLAALFVAQAASGRVLASKPLLNWVAHAPLRPVPSYIDRLTSVAAKDPAIANEVKAMQQRLSDALNQVPQSAAASGPNAQNNEAQRREKVPQR